MSDSDRSGLELATILQDYVSRSDYSDALEAVEAAIAERDEARSAATKHTDRLAQLEKMVRGRAWRDAFETARKDAKVKDDVADDVYRLLGLAEDDDEPDSKQIGKSLAEFLKTRGHYVASDKPGDGKPARIPAGEGSDRGRSGSPGDPEFHVSKQQRNDALWMRDNQSKMNTAAKAGLLRLEGVDF